MLVMSSASLTASLSPLPMRRTSTPPPSVLPPAPRARVLPPILRSTLSVSRTVSPTTTGRPSTVLPRRPALLVPRTRPLPLPSLLLPRPPGLPPMRTAPPPLLPLSLMPPLPTPLRPPLDLPPALLPAPLLSLPRLAMLLPPSLVVSLSSVSSPLSSLCKLDRLFWTSG
uniref:Uncharacterized protein n=1 Tax=Fusarium oxysporum (strain Fo5176) TaxID=660025 RepID=A0A0D2X9J9_FUSOF